MEQYVYSANSSSPEFTQAIQQVNSAWLTALAAANAEAVAATYTNDAAAFDPSLGKLSGRATIQAVYQAAIDQGLRWVMIETQELRQEGACAYETGIYAILNDQQIAIERGHYLVVWQQEGGQWKWHRHIWNHQFKAGH